MIIHDDLLQGSPEWHKLRAGKFTASTVAALFMKESTKGYQDLLKKIARERLTGNPVETFKSEWMQRGSELEGRALRQYEFDNFILVKKIGFIEIDSWIGCSPDGLVSEHGMIQVKCPKWNTWFDAEIEKDYIIQCQAEMWIAGREWNDLYYYDPELESKVFKIRRDENIIKEIQTRIDIAKPLVEKYMSTIRLRSNKCR